MICPNCNSLVHNIRIVFGKKGKTEYCKYCSEASPIETLIVNTVNLKYYTNNNGNVSENRIKMIKSRKLHPEGNGEVVLMDRGKITDRRANDY